MVTFFTGKPCNNQIFSPGFQNNYLQFLGDINKMAKQHGKIKKNYSISLKDFENRAVKMVHLAPLLFPWLVQYEDFLSASISPKHRLVIK